jgi:hypothetical protein
MILRPSQRTFSNITNKAYEEQITLNMSKLLNGSLRYATDVKVICNDGTEPASADIGDNYKNYIKLSNDYRSTSVKGARGDFERGRVEGGKLKKVGSAITSDTFDEYDFQFSIPSYNCAGTQECMTIGVKAMAMDIGEDAEITAATGISKPNPDFIPNFDKSYQYTETFEFLNLRNSAVINKITSPLVIDTYNPGAKVVGLDDDGDGFYNPKASGVDNTIWIFFTNPNEAKDKDSSGGGTPAPGGGTPAPGSGDSTGDGGTGDDTTASAASGGIPGSASPGKGNNEHGNTGEGNQGKGNGRDNTGNSTYNANTISQGNGTGTGNGNSNGKGNGKKS